MISTRLRSSPPTPALASQTKYGMNMRSFDYDITVRSTEYLAKPLKTVVLGISGGQVDGQLARGCGRVELSLFSQKPHSTADHF